MLYKYLLYFASVLILTACQSTLGPESLRNTHPSYNQALSDSLNSEMLLNLVRLKYRDEILFLKINSITTSLTFTTTLGTNIGFTGSNLGVSTLTPSTGLSYSQLPTISYSPMAGEAFFKSIMTPIPLDSLFALIRNGWNIERIFNMCVERVNDLYNPPNHESSSKHEAETFRRMTFLLRKLQRSHSIEIGHDKKELAILFKQNPDNIAYIDELQSLLNIHSSKKEPETFTVVDGDFMTKAPNRIIIEVRGISNIMHYLAQNVSIPKDHLEDGLTDNPKKDIKIDAIENKDNASTDFFNIKVSSLPPGDAFISVPYRDNWYYISDNDLNSKSVFQLLTNLFELQAGQSTSTTGVPILTIPAR
jgi:hypothetical protein